MLELTKFKMADQWSEEDKRRALKKIADVAHSHEPSNVGGLQGFLEGGAMTPTQFREQLKRNFQIFLSPEELGAIFNTFDSDGDGTIDCNEFLFHFFRLGAIEKDKYRERQQKLNKLQREEREQRIAALKKKMEDSVVARLEPSTEEDRVSFEAKLHKAARNYEPRAWIGRSAELDSVSMTPTVFREQLKQEFDITVTAGELDAGVKLFSRGGAVGEGLVDTKFFIATFFRIGQEEKSKAIEQFFRRKAKLEAKIAQREREEIEKLAKLNETNVEWPELPPQAGISLPPSAQTKLRPNLKSPNAGDDHLPRLDTTHTTEGSMFESTTTTDNSEGPRKGKIVRKASMAVIFNSMSTNTITSSKKSFVDAFPKVTQPCRDFLADVERREHEIKAIRRGRKNQKMKESDASQGTDERYYENTRPSMQHGGYSYESPSDGEAMRARPPRIQFTNVGEGNIFENDANSDFRPVNIPDEFSSVLSSRPESRSKAHKPSSSSGGLYSNDQWQSNPTIAAFGKNANSARDANDDTERFQVITLDQVGRSSEFIRSSSKRKGNGTDGEEEGSVSTDGNDDSYEQDIYDD